MSREENEKKWKNMNDPRSKEDRIREARTHIRTHKQRRMIAEDLQQKRNKLSADQQIAALDERCGKNYGAKKERKRLQSPTVEGGN